MGGFKKFLLRGNIVDLAVAVVIGVAFNAVIHALINDVITPLIGAAGGVPDFSSLQFTFHKSHFHYGSFINAALSFLVMALVIYYFVVVPANRITSLATRNQAATARPCPECVSDIPVAATRCKFCTAVVEPVVNGKAAQGAPAGAGAHRARTTWRPRS